MKELDFLTDALGELDDSLIIEAENIQKRKRPALLRIAALAACFVLIIAALPTAFLISHLGQTGIVLPESTTEQSEAAGETADAPPETNGGDLPCTDELADTTPEADDATGDSATAEFVPGDPSVESEENVPGDPEITEGVQDETEDMATSPESDASGGSATLDTDASNSEADATFSPSTSVPTQDGADAQANAIRGHRLLYIIPAAMLASGIVIGILILTDVKKQKNKR